MGLLWHDSDAAEEQETRKLLTVAYHLLKYWQDYEASCLPQAA